MIYISFCLTILYSFLFSYPLQEKEGKEDDNEQCVVIKSKTLYAADKFTII